MSYSTGHGNLIQKDSGGEGIPPIYFQGVLDDLSICNRALNDEEIVGLFKALKYPEKSTLPDSETKRFNDE